MRPIFVTSIWAVGVAALTFTEAPRAADIAQWKTVGDWQIGFDRTFGSGCFMINGYPDGTVLILGFEQKARNGYVMIRNDTWRSLDAGKEYPLVLRFNDESSWRVNAAAIGNPVFLYMIFDTPDFIYDFARKLSVSISYAGRIFARLPLKSTYAAVEEMAVCQRTVHDTSSGSPPDDPFDSSCSIAE